MAFQLHQEKHSQVPLRVDSSTSKSVASAASPALGDGVSDSVIPANDREGEFICGRFPKMTFTSTGKKDRWLELHRISIVQPPVALKRALNVSTVSCVTGFGNSTV